MNRLCTDVIDQIWIIAIDQRHTNRTWWAFMQCNKYIHAVCRHHLLAKYKQDTCEYLSCFCTTATTDSIYLKIILRRLMNTSISVNQNLFWEEHSWKRVPMKSDREHKCTALTLTGKKCKRNAKRNFEYCWQHQQ